MTDNIHSNSLAAGSWLVACKLALTYIYFSNICHKRLTSPILIHLHVHVHVRSIILAKKKRRKLQNIGAKQRHPVIDLLAYLYVSAWCQTENFKHIFNRCIQNYKCMMTSLEYNTRLHFSFPAWEFNPFFLLRVIVFRVLYIIHNFIFINLHCIINSIANVINRKYINVLFCTHQYF